MTCTRIGSAARAVHERYSSYSALAHVNSMQVLRRRVVAGITELQEAVVAQDLLRDLSPHYVEHELLAARVWQLRHNLTAYDASYVALVELLRTDLVTTDAKLASAPGHQARVVLL